VKVLETNSGSGLGLYPIIFMVIFIKRYLAGMDISNVHNWIGIAITSFYWFIGIVITLFVIVIVAAAINAIRD